jgi:hypothetical protein
MVYLPWSGPYSGLCAIVFTVVYVDTLNNTGRRFAPANEGMDEQIEISNNLTRFNHWMYNS